MSADEEKQFIRQHVNALMEHFDAVHIFAERKDEKDPDTTIGLSMGSGSWYARHSMAEEYVLQVRERWPSAKTSEKNS